MTKKEDLTGQVFNRLTVLHEVLPQTRPSKWLCKCECGNKKEVRGSSLKNGNTKSCGCFNKEASARRATKHGARSTKLYRTYSSMLSRCRNVTSSSYAHYGAKGISVCDDWSSFVSFQTWALANGYSDDLTLDRIDSKGDYEPGNCRWSTRTMQSRNRGAFVNKTSKYIGVSWNSQYSKWNATICVDGIPSHIGRFIHEVDAAIARDEFITKNDLKGFPLNFT